MVIPASSPRTPLVQFSHIRCMNRLIDFNNANIQFNGRVPIDWMHVTADMFNYFGTHVIPDLDFQHPAPSWWKPFGMTPTTGAVGATLTRLQKGIKPLKNEYPILTKDSEFVSWRDGFNAIAHTHELHHLINAAYTTPRTAGADRDIHIIRNDFLFATLMITAKTDKSMDIVRKHSVTRDGVAAWTEIVEWYTTSHEAEVTISNLRTSLYGMNLTPAWNGTYYSFFRTFQKKVHEYHRLVSTALRIPDDLLKAQLHVAVDSMVDFVLLKRHATISAAATFDEVLAVYMEHAAALDKTRKAKPVARIANEHQLSYTEDDYALSDEEWTTVWNARSRPSPMTRNMRQPEQPRLRLSKVIWVIKSVKYRPL
jgi:hypothetical protein